MERLLSSELDPVVGLYSAILLRVRWEPSLVELWQVQIELVLQTVIQSTKQR